MTSVSTSIISEILQNRVKPNVYCHSHVTRARFKTGDGCVKYRSWNLEVTKLHFVPFSLIFISKVQISQMKESFKKC